MNWPRPYGPYQLLRPVAEGGMAEIYLAAMQGNAGERRLLAIKMLRDNVATDDELISALTSEALITVRLNHPNVVQTFDLAQHDDRYSLVMEYVEGRDLSLLIEKMRKSGQRMPFAAVAYVVGCICRGLHYAHTRCDEQGLPLNIVHRDISPQNVLLGFNGDVKVADFGIAKANVDRKETRVGVIKGKFQYMSPEQAWGDRLDARSDVYCVGSVMFELLTNEPLYEFTDQFEVLRAVRAGSPRSPSELRADVPMDLEAIAMYALERDRNQRFQSARVMNDAITTYLNRTAEGYGQADLSAFVKQIFRDEAADAAMIRRALEPNNATRATVVREEVTPVPSLMGRDDYLPDREMSLLFNVRAMQQAAGALAQGEVQLPAGMLDDLTREIDEESEEHDEEPTMALSLKDLHTIMRSELPGVEEDDAGVGELTLVSQAPDDLRSLDASVLEELPGEMTHASRIPLPPAEPSFKEVGALTFEEESADTTVFSPLIREQIIKSGVNNLSEIPSTERVTSAEVAEATSRAVSHPVAPPSLDFSAPSGLVNQPSKLPAALIIGVAVIVVVIVVIVSFML